MRKVSTCPRRRARYVLAAFAAAPPTHSCISPSAPRVAVPHRAGEVPGPAVGCDRQAPQFELHLRTHTKTSPRGFVGWHESATVDNTQAAARLGETTRSTHIWRETTAQPWA